ncbi:MAG: acyltransferase family protein [Bacteroidales bacterium]|nr:acyltransferase family protein [Bacteroidales bacterium]
MKQRTFYLDNLCGLMLLYMIFFVHIAGQYNPCWVQITKAIFSCFMSWFFFKGGMMHRLQSMSEITLKSVKRLFVPYVIFLVIGFLLDVVRYHYEGIDVTRPVFYKYEIHTFLTTSIFWSTGASWFLLTLFVVRLIFNALCPKMKPYVITIVFAVLSCMLWWLEKMRIEQQTSFYIPFYIGTMCHGLAVYSLGFSLKEKQFSKLWILLAIAVEMLRFIVDSRIDFRSNNAGSDFFPLGIVYGMAGCIVFNNIFKRWLDRPIPLVTYIGRNSMVYYLMHYPIMIISISLLKEQLHGIDSVRFLCIISGIVIVGLILSDLLFRIKKLHFIIGK